MTPVWIHSTGRATPGEVKHLSALNTNHTLNNLKLTNQPSQCLELLAKSVSSSWRFSFHLLVYSSTVAVVQTFWSTSSWQFSVTFLELFTLCTLSSSIATTKGLYLFTFCRFRLCHRRFSFLRFSSHTIPSYVQFSRIHYFDMTRVRWQDDGGTANLWLDVRLLGG